MQLIDRIEKRRFVGREFLLWLWFESELLDATLTTREHGSFGLWLERRLTLSAGKESTKITAPLPGLGREAKEALLRGQLPHSAGIRLAWKGDENAFVLDAERLSIAGLKLRTALDDADEEGGSGPSLEELRATMQERPARKGKRRDADDESHEVFYERMRLTEEFEGLLAALYRDFLTLRLGTAFDEHVVPALRRWANGAEVDAEAYSAARQAALAGKERRNGRPAPTVSA